MSFNAFNMDDTGTFGEQAPRPIDEESVARGGFDRLGEGEGAVVAKRGQPGSSAHEGGARLSKRIVAGIAVAAIVVIALVAVLFVRVLSAPVPTVHKDEPSRIAVAMDQSIAYHDVTFSLEEQDGVWRLMQTSEAPDGTSTSVSLGDLSGVPAGMALFDGTLVIPLNLADGTWSVMAYASDTGWSSAMDHEGKPYGGPGVVQDMRLEGTNLQLTVDGQPVSVPLAW